MADKRKGKKRKDEFSLGEEKVEKPSKEEYAVAKWLKKNVPAKRTKFLNHNIEYFTGCKAVDALMDSQWAKEDSETHFSTRVHCVNFLDMMLRHKFFHRAKKVPVSEKELRAKLKKKEKKPIDEKKKDDKEKNKKKEEELAESSHAEGKDEGKEKQDEGDKKKRKIRLEMHLEQLFADGLDAYVWIYDPIPLYYWLFGALLVLAAIGVCLFPLWPPSVRMGVYYLSVAAAGFLMLIIALAALRLVVFCIIWLLTLGKHHLWLFPNLTEDVGFFASFWPLYHSNLSGHSWDTYKYTGDDKANKKKKKDKDSDVEEDDDEDEKEDEDEDSGRSQGEEEGEEKADSMNRSGDAVVDKKEKISRNGGGEEEEGGVGDSETESEGSSQQSQTGKDFEIVDRADIQES